MGWCDPCAADPLSNEELRELGVFWLPSSKASPIPTMPVQNVFITRLHLRYDQANFQGRYVLRYPWQGSERCPAAQRYLSEELPRRREQEAQNLAYLTGWDINEIRKKMKFEAPPKADEPWWKSLWKKGAPAR